MTKRTMEAVHEIFNQFLREGTVRSAAGFCRDWLGTNENYMSNSKRQASVSFNIATRFANALADRGHKEMAYRLQGIMAVEADVQRKRKTKE